MTSDMQVLKLALNYHWDQDPRAAWADAPVFGVGSDAGQGAPRPNPTGMGGRCRHTLLVQQRQEKNTSGNGILTSQLTYSNLTGQSGEFFARVDTPSRSVRERLCRRRRPHRR